MLQVLIAGAGISGLTLALSLAKHGINSRIFEARDVPPREGAGIQLGPNATRVLQHLGLNCAVEQRAIIPDCIIVNDGRSGAELTRLPLGNWISERHGAPYGVVHRADLYRILWQQALASTFVEIETGRTVQRVDDADEAEQISIAFAEGGVVSGHVLVGADGLWSRTRQHVDPDATLQFAGTTAARAVVPRSGLPSRFAELATGVWLAPNAHIVHYPVSSGDEVAIVAIGTCPKPPDDWESAITTAAVAQRFNSLFPELQAFLKSAEEWRQWPLYRAEQSSSWSKGRAILIGDAAHPILPFLAQGGAMAIEDGFELAAVLSKTGPENLIATIQAFSQRRRARVTKVQAASLQNGQAYHLDGLPAVARNAALSLLPGSIFMRRYDWIYGYKS